MDEPLAFPELDIDFARRTSGGKLRCGRKAEDPSTEASCERRYGEACARWRLTPPDSLARRRASYVVEYWRRRRLAIGVSRSMIERMFA
jgi:hypothetical protein